MISFVSANALNTVCFLQKDYEELATTVMTIVDCVVNKTRVSLSSVVLLSLLLQRLLKQG